MQWQAVFFDFDGVIVDSVPLKAQAFGKMFEKYGATIRNQVIEFHLQHAGMTRHEKFRHYYQNLLHQAINEAQVEALSQQFAKLVEEKTLQCPLIPGVQESLERLKRANIPAYVVSAVPDQELRGLIQKKQLAEYFSGVFGSPRTKSEILHQLLQRSGYLSKMCLFIGDTLTDQKAAADNHLQFLGIVLPGRASSFPQGVRTTAVVAVD